VRQRLRDTAVASDPLAAGWKGVPVCEKLHEDSDHRILRCSFPPGIGHERHFHDRHFGYALAGGRMRINDANGTREVDLATGSSFLKCRSRLARGAERRRYHGRVPDRRAEVTTNPVSRVRVSATRELATGVGLAVLLAGCSTTSPPPPSIWDGLEKQPVRYVDALYVNPAASLTAYPNSPGRSAGRQLRRELAFQHRHKPEPRQEPDVAARSRASGMLSRMHSPDIRTRAGDLRLCAGEAAGADTLHVSPGLAGVYLNTPPGTMLTWKQYMGRMILVMEMRDGPTGQLLARVVDEEVGDLACSSRRTPS